MVGEDVGRRTSLNLSVIAQFISHSYFVIVLLKSSATKPIKTGAVRVY